MRLNENTIILPISYFPPAEYIRLAWSQECLLEANENYQKRSIRNRSTILAANGPLNLGVPLTKGKTTKHIKEVRISQDEPWATSHIRALRSAYGSAPYFEHYGEEIFALIRKKWTFLYDLNHSILVYLVSNQICPEIQETTDFHPESAYYQDLRPSGTAWDFAIKPYNQVFEDKYGFVKDLSILDMLFNLGPETESHLSQ